MQITYIYEDGKTETFSEPFPIQKAMARVSVYCPPRPKYILKDSQIVTEEELIPEQIKECESIIKLNPNWEDNEFQDFYPEIILEEIISWKPE